MPNTPLWRRALLLLLAAGFLCASVFPARRAEVLREEHQLTSRTHDESTPPEYVLTSALLGGFRGIFITTLWVRAQEMKNDGKYFELVDIYNIITKLQPNHHAAWAFQAWDLTYNVSVEHVSNYNDRIYWVFKGVDLLRLQGIPKNPNIPELYYELSWFFHHKIGGETDFAHQYYRAYLASQMRSILAGIPPDQFPLLREIAELREAYPTRRAFLTVPVHAAAQAALQKLKLPDPRGPAAREAGGPFIPDLLKLALPLQQAAASRQAMAADVRTFLDNAAHRGAVRRAALWQVGERLKVEVNMNPRLMFDMCKRFGAIDWALAEAHALYWGLQGRDMFRKLKPGPEHVTLKFERTCYPALMKMAYSNDARFFGGAERGSAEKGIVMGLPDYQKIPGVIEYMDEMIAYVENANAINKKNGGRVRTLIGVQSGYRNFLKHTAINAYLDERKDIALKMLTKLKQIDPHPTKWKGVTLKKFILKEAKEHFAGMDTADTLQVLESFVTAAYKRLAMNDVKGYRKKQKWVKRVYAYCNKRWDKEETETDSDEKIHGKRVPELLKIQTKVVLRLLSNPPLDFPERRRGYLMGQVQTREPEVFASVKFEIERMQKSQSRRSSFKRAPEKGKDPAP